MRHTNSVRLLFGMPILYTLSVWLSPERWAYARKHFGVTELKWIIISHWASSSCTCNGVYLNFSLPVQHYILQAFIRPPTTGFRVVRVATRQPTKRHPRNSGTTNLVNFRLPEFSYIFVWCLIIIIFPLFWWPFVGLRLQLSVPANEMKCSSQLTARET